jgi:hypothetical protein
MSLQTWQETLVSANTAGTAFNTYTTAKTVLPVGCLVTLPANWWYVGRTIRVTAMFALSNIVTTPGTLTLQTNLGAVAAFSTGAMQMNATAHTNLPCWYTALLTCRAVGSSTSANLMGSAVVRGLPFTNTAGQTDPVNGYPYLVAPATAPAVGTGFDSTAAQTLDFFAGFSISNVGNQITVHQYLVEALN